MSDEARHIRQLEQLLEQKDNEMGKLRYVSRIFMYIYRTSFISMAKHVCMVLNAPSGFRYGYRLSVLVVTVGIYFAVFKVKLWASFCAVQPE